MKNKINIAELLKNCPSGMELECTIFEDVILSDISKSGTHPICIEIKSGVTIKLTKYGQLLDGGKCVIFPKGKTTWEGFEPPFKDGDIITHNYEIGLVSMILNKFVNFEEIHYHCALYDNAQGFITDNYIEENPKYIRLATEEEKQKLFDAIKANGYKWNTETKTLEKLVEPRFKVGDRVKDKNNFTYTILSIEDWRYIFNDIHRTKVIFAKQDNYELVSDKFDISTLVPFESKVLVRDHKSQTWRPAIWGFYDKNCGNHLYGVIGGNCFAMCIPFKGNEHLRGKIEDCSEYYKTWE